MEVMTDPLEVQEIMEAKIDVDKVSSRRNISG